MTPLEQVVFVFGPLPERKPHPEHPVAVMRWQYGCLRVDWPDFNIHAFFNSWPHALDCVLHNVNEHVSIRVRP